MLLHNCYFKIFYKKILNKYSTRKICYHNHKALYVYKLHSMYYNSQQNNNYSRTYIYTLILFLRIRAPINFYF